eukprot:TRINITY_DN5442_c0_g1_i1.p1 TRINITY_DN5442_c0_g1~~TRINITY_DN5442_c0_g1_i1.p1  ORF type:complete len:432 (+),score=105.71 TRINITY_DN5442_c0_g1_i1:66-1361(+)
MCMNEDFLNEKEALVSIFPDEFKEIGANQISLIIKEEIQQEQTAQITLVIRVSDSYPEVEPDFEIIPYETTIREEMLTYMKEFLTTEAKKRVGQPMIFELLDILRPVLATLKVEQSRGYFWILSYEVICNIFMFIDHHDLGNLLCTSQELNKLLSSKQCEPVWEYHKEKIYPSSALERPTARESFIEISNKLFQKQLRHTPRWLYTFCVLQRRSLGSFPVLPETNFSAALTEELSTGGYTLKRRSVSNSYCEEFGDIYFFKAAFLSEPKWMGTYYIYNTEQTSGNQWASYFTCPYASSPLGYLALDLIKDTSVRSFLDIAVTVCRGKVFHRYKKVSVDYMPLTLRYVKMKLLYSKKKKQILTIQLSPDQTTKTMLLAPVNPQELIGTNSYQANLMSLLEKDNYTEGYHNVNVNFWVLDFKLPENFYNWLLK